MWKDQKKENIMMIKVSVFVKERMDMFEPHELSLAFPVLHTNKLMPENAFSREQNSFLTVTGRRLWFLFLFKLLFKSSDLSLGRLWAFLLWESDPSGSNYVMGLIEWRLICFIVGLYKKLQK